MSEIKASDAMTFAVVIAVHVAEIDPNLSSPRYYCI
jgi:hypothetical protein